MSEPQPALSPVQVDACRVLRRVRSDASNADGPDQFPQLFTVLQVDPARAAALAALVLGVDQVEVVWQSSQYAVRRCGSGSRMRYAAAAGTSTLSMLTATVSAAAPADDMRCVSPTGESFEHRTSQVRLPSTRGQSSAAAGRPPVRCACSWSTSGIVDAAITMCHSANSAEPWLSSRFPLRRIKIARGSVSTRSPSPCGGHRAHPVGLYSTAHLVDPVGSPNSIGIVPHSNDAELWCSSSWLTSAVLKFVSPAPSTPSTTTRRQGSSLKCATRERSTDTLTRD